MSRTNEVEGEFQQVWGVPVLFAGSLGVFCSLSPQAVVAAVAGTVPVPAACSACCGVAEPDGCTVELSAACRRSHLFPAAPALLGRGVSIRHSPLRLPGRCWGGCLGVLVAPRRWGPQPPRDRHRVAWRLLAPSLLPWWLWLV